MKFRNLEIYVDYGKTDPEIIRSVEGVFNIRFPNLYIQLMLKHNGASIEQNCFEYDVGERMGEIGFDAFETAENPDGSNILRQYLYDDLIYGYEHVYSFGHTGDGNWICFDYRDNPAGDEPKICIVIHDEYDKKTGKHLLFPVADNFEAFLDGLKTFDEIMAKYE